MNRRALFLFALAASTLPLAGCPKPGALPRTAAANAANLVSAPQFTVTVSSEKLSTKTNGRLMIILAPNSGSDDLRGRLDDVEAARNGAAFGIDAALGGGVTTASVDGAAKTVAAFPLDAATKLAPGTYRVQAAFAFNPDLRDVDAPGNLYSTPQTITLPAPDNKPIALSLSEAESADKLPADSATTKWIEIRSEKLSKFYKRPILLRAGVVLPSNYSETPTASYPMCVRIGGFHTRYTAARYGQPAENIVQVYLDGDGPFGDSYQVNSAVSGPYGDATIEELLPAIEKRFHCGGSVKKRFTTGGSTGGWVSLALQIYYPDTFGGCWSGYPDPLDFRSYQATDLYKDTNAYTNNGNEVTSARDVFTGSTKWTVREECSLENVRGFGGSYVTSGGQWGVWNTVFGQPDKDGRAIPFWNPVTGEINHPIAEKAGARYDLRRYCEANWKKLAPKLDGKIHLWVGERDEYFLNEGVHKFEDFLKTATPSIQTRIEYSPLAGHGWEPRSRSVVLAEMVEASGK